MDVKSFIEKYEDAYRPTDGFSRGLFTGAAFLEGYASGVGGNDRITELADFLKNVGSFIDALRREAER